jgi:outer membrane protein assembly factor BamA
LKPLALEFEGSKVFGNQRLLEIATKCRAESATPTVQEKIVVEYCLHKVKSFMANNGYLQATLGETISATTEAEILLKVPVSEGALFRLQEVKIDGPTVFPPARLREMLKLRTGDVANGDAIGEWLFDAVKKAYHQLGYIQYTAEVEPDFHLKQGSTEGTVDLAIAIDEGQRFYVRSIHFDGNGDVPENLLSALMLIQSGDVYNSELLKQSLARIDQTRQFETIDFDKDLDFRSAQDSRQVDVVIHLKKKASANVKDSHTISRAPGQAHVDPIRRHVRSESNSTRQCRCPRLSSYLDRASRSLATKLTNTIFGPFRKGILRSDLPATLSLA